MLIGVFPWLANVWWNPLIFAQFIIKFVVDRNPSKDSLVEFFQEFIQDGGGLERQLLSGLGEPLARLVWDPRRSICLAEVYCDSSCQRNDKGSSSSPAIKSPIYPIHLMSDCQIRVKLSRIFFPHKIFQSRSYFFFQNTVFGLSTWSTYIELNQHREWLGFSKGISRSIIRSKVCPITFYARASSSIALHFFENARCNAVAVGDHSAKILENLLESKLLIQVCRKCDANKTVPHHAQLVLQREFCKKFFLSPYNPRLNRTTIFFPSL